MIEHIFQNIQMFEWHLNIRLNQKKQSKEHLEEEEGEDNESVQIEEEEDEAIQNEAQILSQSKLITQDINKLLKARRDARSKSKGGGGKGKNKVGRPPSSKKKNE